MRGRAPLVLTAVGILLLLAFLFPRVRRTSAGGVTTLSVGAGVVPWIEVERERSLVTNPGGGWTEGEAVTTNLEPVKSTFVLGLAGLLALVVARRLRRTSSAG